MHGLSAQLSRSARGRKANGTKAWAWPHAIIGNRSTLGSV